MQIQNANTKCKYFGCPSKYHFSYFFSLSDHGPIAGFADTEESIFLSAMAYKGPLNPGKAVQERSVVWRGFCISTDVPEQRCTSPAPCPWPAIHTRRGHGQSTLRSRPGASEKGRTSRKHPWSRICECQKPQRAQRKVESHWLHHPMPSPCIVSTYSTTLETSRKGLMVDIRWWSSDICYLVY